MLLVPQCTSSMQTAWSLGKLQERLRLTSVTTVLHLPLLQSIAPIVCRQEGPATTTALLQVSSLQEMDAKIDNMARSGAHQCQRHGLY